MEASQMVFNTHIIEDSFQMCIDNGMWGLEGYDPSSSPWPFVIFWISAAKKKDCPDKYFFRFSLDGYPETAPSACPWNAQSLSRLDNSRWPKGGIKTSSIFNPAWKPDALYLACDRVAMEGHGQWQVEHPNLWWKSEFKIDIYLRQLHKTLNAADYTHE